MNLQAPATDLDDIVEQDRAEVELIHPATGAPLGQFITILGPEHPRRKKLEQERAREIRREFRKTNRMPVSDPVEDEAEALETLVTLTESFTDTQGKRPVIVGGKPVTKEEAHAFYSDPRRAWAARQVLRALGEQDRFIASSAKS